MAYKRIASFVLALLLSACGGGGGGSDQSSAPPPASPQQPMSTATLAQGVVLLTDAQNAQYVGRSAAGDEVIFSGQVNLTAGQVVVAGTDTFKVASVRQEGGNTIVSVTEPALDELFDKLQISGSFTASATDITAETLPPDARLSRNLSGAPSSQTLKQGLDVATYSWSAQINAGGVSVASGIKGTVRADVDYSFDKWAGGLKNGRFELITDAAITGKIKANASASATTREIPVGRIRIPIPLSIVDRALNVLGVRLASIYVPIAVGAKGSAEFALNYDSTVNLNGSLGAIYTPEAGSQVLANFTSQVADGSFAPTTPAGAPVLATYKATTAVFVHMRPALMFLNQVALLGVDATVTGNGTHVVQVVPESPWYCFKTTPSVEIEANGFFKSVSVREIKSPPVMGTLYTGSTGELGRCRAPVVLTVTSTTPAPAVYGKSTVFNVTVNIDPAVTLSAPSTGPTGSVVVAVGSGTCTAALTAQSTSSATGSCTLVPPTAGESAEVALTYAGDQKYGPKVSKAPVRIDRGEVSLVGVSTTSPNPSLPGQPVIVNATILAPGLPLQPTGSIGFFTANGDLLCTALVNDNGTASCSAAFAQLGAVGITPVYSGDARLKPYTGIAYQHTVGAPISGPVNITGSAVITGGCSGTLTLSGTGTYDLTPGAETLRVTGNQIFTMPCFNQTTALDYILPLTRSGNVVTGSFTNRFTCPYPCDTGSDTVSVSATVSQSGASVTVSGTLTETHRNQTPFSAQASGLFTASRP